MTAAQPTPTPMPPIDLDGYTGRHEHDHPLHRERGFAFFAPAPEGAAEDSGHRLEAARRDRLLFDLAAWHHDVAPTYVRARAAEDRAHEAVRVRDEDPTDERHDAAVRAVRAYACARSDLLVLLDRQPIPRGGESLYERYVPERTRIDPTTLTPEADLRRRVGLLP
ncbi:hypothetical protein [Embleya sp. NPDC050493]|uniref:hypothetical protein n=1 Tax=Embleya sp. NPDC050493 TaxID=3363989 RepID=UPI0037A364AF